MEPTTNNPQVQQIPSVPPAPQMQSEPHLIPAKSNRTKYILVIIVIIVCVSVLGFLFTNHSLLQKLQSTQINSQKNSAPVTVGSTSITKPMEISTVYTENEIGMTVKYYRAGV